MADRIAQAVFSPGRPIRKVLETLLRLQSAAPNQYRRTQGTGAFSGAPGFREERRFSNCSDKNLKIY